MTATKVTTHLHCCRSCAATYLDNCTIRHVNDRCNPCISGLPSTFAAGRLPAACCRRRTRLATKADIATYRLGGERPWWLCHTCHRPFGYDPTKDPR